VQGQGWFGWYDATVEEITEDGDVRVTWADGSDATTLRARYIRLVKAMPKDKTAELDDDEYRQMLADMREQYKEILEDEGVVTQAFNEVRQRVDNMEELVQLQKEALLPSKLQQLANRFEGQELVCQRMIRRAKEALVALRAEDADVDEDDLVHISLTPVRNSIARVRGKEFKELVQGFFTARAHNREEMLKRASRQLRYAYPDALEEELNDILEFPELAAVAIAQRLEKGAEGVTLDGILAQMEGKKADARKIEQGAKELKLMFLQFAELIDNQGEALNQIESNIKTVIEQTQEAIGTLIEAEEEKRSYERKWLKFYVIGFILLFWFVIWPIYDAIFPPERDYDDYRRGGYFGGYGRWYNRSDDTASAHFGDALGNIGSSIFSLGHKAGKKFYEYGGHYGHEIYEAAEKRIAPEHYEKSRREDKGDARDQFAASKSGSAPDSNQEQRNGDAEQDSSLAQTWSYRRGKWTQHPASTEHRNGFIAPRPRRFPVPAASSVDSPLLHQIALTARGGGVARHSGLRKSRLSPDR
jgi:t-SNARE complex subunit (syntaxin)